MKKESNPQIRVIYYETEIQNRIEIMNQNKFWNKRGKFRTVYHSGIITGTLGALFRSHYQSFNDLYNRVIYEYLNGQFCFDDIDQNIFIFLTGLNFNGSVLHLKDGSYWRFEPGWLKVKVEKLKKKSSLTHVINSSQNFQ